MDEFLQNLDIEVLLPLANYLRTIPQRYEGDCFLISIAIGEIENEFGKRVM